MEVLKETIKLVFIKVKGKTKDKDTSKCIHELKS